MASNSESSIVSKCGNVLDIIAASRQPLVFRDIVEKSGLAKSSAHRILSILVHEKLIEHDPLQKVYRYGSRMNRWARAAWTRIDPHENAAAELDQLSAKTDMNSAVSVLDGDTILYLRANNSFDVRYTSHAGDRAPLHSTAAGKVLLADLPLHQQQDIVSRLDFERMTEYTIVQTDTLLAELEITRARGYGISLREEYLQVVGMAAPIKDLHGDVIAALSLWTLIDRVDLAAFESVAPQVIASAARLSAFSAEL